MHKVRCSGENGTKSLSRRALLEIATSGIGATLAAGVLSGSGPSPQLAGTDAHAPGSPSPASMPKGFSRAELERRWQRVRERMKQQRFDCLICPQQSENNADIRYLTDTGAGWVVFPLEGKPAAIFDSERAAAPAKLKKDWGLDVRVGAGNGKWSEDIVDGLRGLRMERARIGVGNLSGVLRNEEGGVSATTLERIRKELPKATLESAADLLMRVKLVHSEEEIAVFEIVQAVSEAGLRAMMEMARPGIVHRDVWLRMYQTMLAASGEPPSRVSFRAGAEGNSADGLPLDEVLRPGLVMNQEIDGTVLGIRSQCNHSVLLGSPAPADWPSAAQYCIELYLSMVDWIAPGKSFKDLLEFYHQKVQQRAGQNVRLGGVILHTGGWGDGPRMGPGRMEGFDDSLMEAGMIFTMKPSVPIRNSTPAAQFGDAVVVTGTGARRLGKRKLEVLTLGA